MSFDQFASVHEDIAPNTADEIKYEAYPTAARFHKDTKSFVRVILGPVGGGKTTACIMEILSKAITQEPFKNIRKSRWAVVRQTYPELRNTTLKTWKEWIPERMCHVNMQPPYTGVIKEPLPDGTVVECEVIFLALDQPDDVRKLKSIEFTGIYINEVRYCDETIFQTCKERVGRYPAMKPEEGFYGASWHGIIADTNAWATTHWLYETFDTGATPEGYTLYEQPPAIFWVNDGGGKGHWEVNPDADNLQYLKPSYYRNQLIGGKDDILRVELGLERGISRMGKPVFPNFSQKLHVAPKVLDPRRGLPLLLAFDFGLNPACLVGQLMPMGILQLTDAISPADESFESLCDDYVLPLLSKRYPGYKILGTGDPSNARSGIDKRTPIMALGERGIIAHPARTNKFLPRKEAVDWLLDRHKLQISPHLVQLIEGMSGGYYYSDVQGQKGSYKERPDKTNPYSHIIDCLQYMALYIKYSMALQPMPSNSTKPKFRYA